jgi:hypothetical protein
VSGANLFGLPTVDPGVAVTYCKHMAYGESIDCRWVRGGRKVALLFCPSEHMIRDWR